jgi:hypothetical protein
MLENPMVTDECWDEPERVQVDVCEVCEKVIYSGDIYYDLNNHTYCEPCVDVARREAEENE